MHRAVLQACLPWFVWLCVAGGLAFLLAQYCGGRPDWRRLRRLSACEEGAIQSLSLVLIALKARRHPFDLRNRSRRSEILVRLPQFAASSVYFCIRPPPFRVIMVESDVAYQNEV